MNSEGKRRKGLFILGAALVILIILTCVMMLVVNFQMNDTKHIEQGEYKEYERHYVLIATDDAEVFWDSVYFGAREYGEQTGSYIEYMGSDIAVDYSRKDLLKIAISANVDGIILEGTTEPDILELVDEAVDIGIPVVTVLSDIIGSKRQSYVGINSYKLGQDYGKQVLEHSGDGNKRVMMLMNDDANGFGQNIVYTALNEMILEESTGSGHIQIETVTISGDTVFGAEEKIRDIFMNADELPDMLICMNPVYTTSASQAAVDYNKVGQVEIIGYYASDTILSAIKNGVITSTIAIDTVQMGEQAVEALNEYIATGHVSDYVTVDTNLITAKNVKEYMNEE